MIKHGSALTAPSATAPSPEEAREPIQPATPAADPAAPQDDPVDQGEETAEPTEPTAPAEPVIVDDDEEDDEPAGDPPPQATAFRFGAIDRGRLMLASKRHLIGELETAIGARRAAEAAQAAAEARLTAVLRETDTAVHAAEQRIVDLQAERDRLAAEARTVSAGVRDELAALGVTAADAPPVLAAGDPAALTKEEARRQFAELSAKDPAAGRAYYLEHRDLLL